MDLPAEAARTRPGWKSWLLRSVGLIILAILLTRMDFPALGRTLLQISPLYLLLALAANFAAVALKAVRWRYILISSGRTDTFPRVLAANFAGYFLGLLSPGQAGEFAKVALLPAGDARLLPGVLADRLLDVFPLVLLGVAGGVLYLRFSLWSLGVVLILCTGALLLLPVLKRRRPALERLAVRGQSKPARLAGKVLEACLPLLSVRLAPLLLLVVVVQFFLFLYVVLLAWALDLQLPFHELIFFISLLSLSRILAITVMGVGTRDALAVYLFGTAGIGSEQALSFSFSILFVDAVYLLAGFLVYLHLTGRRNPAPANQRL